MVKIEWFDLESDIAKKYLEIATEYIEMKYKKYKGDGGTLPQKMENAVFTNVKDFLKSTRSELQKNSFFSDYMNEVGKTHSADDALKKIFNYGYISHKDDIRHKLLASLKVDCCPYCNRQYITSWTTRKRRRKTTADLDHFYPKDIFPLFALSLFNFVPSCQICNSRMKHDQWKECLYPYEESFGTDAVFRVSSDDTADTKDDVFYQKLLDTFLGKADGNFSIVIDNMAANADLHEKIENSKALFKLEEVYQTHQEYVRELLIKQRIYNEGAYLKMLKQQFDDMGVHFSESELELFLYGFRWDNEDHHKRPLSKLTYDIVKSYTK